MLEEIELEQIRVRCFSRGSTRIVENYKEGNVRTMEVRAMQIVGRSSLLVHR